MRQEMVYQEEKYKGYSISLIYDPDPQSPREFEENRA